MDSKKKRGRPPKEEGGIHAFPYDDVRKWVEETPTITAAEVVSKLGLKNTKSNLTKVGTFLKKITEGAGKVIGISTDGTIKIPVTATASNSNTSGKVGYTLIAPFLDGTQTPSDTLPEPSLEAKTVVDALKGQTILTHIEGIAKKVVLNPRILYWYGFAVSEGFDGDIGDFISDAVEDFYGRRKLDIGIIRKQR